MSRVPSLAGLLGILSAILLVGGGVAFGWEYTTVQERDATIASMKAQEAINVAAAEKVVRDAAAKDAAKTDALVTQLQSDLADQQKAGADARVALASIPTVTAAPGCPDIMASPLIAAFTNGLPN